VLQNASDWLLVEDEDLRSASLDFIYQFTSTSDNLETLLRTVDVPVLAQRLSKLLLFGARKVPYNTRHVHQVEDEPQPVQVPKLAKGLVEKLLEYDEPSRSSHW